MSNLDATRTAPPQVPDTVTADPDVTHTHPSDGPSESGYLVVPGYEVLDVIARGGMGIVYKARQMAVNRIVALKMTLGWADASPTAAARFQIEAEAVAALQHPGIVQLFEFGQAGHARFLALEYVPCGTLTERMAKRPFTPHEAAELVATLADAVHAAHQKGVIHRDLKPGNVLMTVAGSPKIADFGLARIGRSDLTHAGAIMGTPSYMSPEQATGDVKAIGTPADVWALGAILYTLLTGRPPFRRPDVASTLHAVIHDQPTSLRWHNRKVPRDLENVCLKCLSKDPADRYRTADALAADLRAYLGGFPVAARPVGFIRRLWKLARRNPIRTLITLSVLAVGVTLGAFLPRMTPATGSQAAQRRGVWVEADRDAQDVLSIVSQSSTAYRYSGGPVHFWLELLQPGQADARLEAEPWLESEEELRSKDGQVISGRWIWVRGERDKKFDDLWHIALDRRWTKAEIVGAKLDNQLGEVASINKSNESNQRIGKLGITLSLPLTSWTTTSGAWQNPIAEDQPICLRTVRCGSVNDPSQPLYSIRVMCQVTTPAFMSQRTAEKEKKLAEWRADQEAKQRPGVESERK